MNTRYITVDFSGRSGRIKPVNGAVSGPMTGIDLSCDFSDEFREAGIPAVRVHNAEFPYGSGQFVDIHCIFPDPTADEEDELSYNFGPTDAYLLAIRQAGAEIFLRLGESTDPFTYKRYISPPADPYKWARILEHIIAHYNEGWCSGFKLKIKYCEIWSGADDPDGFSGSAEDYFNLYRITATHLRSRFPTLRIGGYSSGGFHSLHRYGLGEREVGYVDFMDGFFDRLVSSGEDIPMDFFSWQCFAESPEELSLHANYAKALLAQYGMKKTRSIVSEFNLASAMSGGAHLSREYPAQLASALIIAQKSGIDMMFYSSLDPRSRTCVPFSCEDRVGKRRYAAFRALSAFGALAALKNAVTVSEDYRRELYSLASFDGERGAILLVTRDFRGDVTLNIRGADFTKYSLLGILGGGERGEGFATEERDIPLTAGGITLRTGKNEIYLVTLGM